MKDADKQFFSITIISDESSWMQTWIDELAHSWQSDGHKVTQVNKPSDIKHGDFCFILSCGKLIEKSILDRNKHNLVVHESALPIGKGWSPLTWQILEGANKISVTLFEAEPEIDAGAIYLQTKIKLNGHELVEQLRLAQAEATLLLCRKFIKQFPKILTNTKPQSGKSSFYPRRTPKDSVLDPNQSIAKQFNLLRVVDNQKYPAFFTFLGHKYIIKIEKAPKDDL